MNGVDVEVARQIALNADSCEKVEYLARAAVLLRELEFVDGSCPMCKYYHGHRWQCDLMGALDTLDGLMS